MKILKLSKMHGNANKMSNVIVLFHSTKYRKPINKGNHGDHFERDKR